MAASKIKVWDLGVRLFHWTLVVLFVVAYASGDEFDSLHEFAGYGILALVAFRLLWGVVGGRHARFVSFVTAPGAALEYLSGLLNGRSVRHLGHNPAGAWMVVLLLLSLGMCGFTGWMTERAEEQATNGAELAATASGTAAGLLQTIHDGDHERDDLEEQHESHEEDDEESQSEEFWEEWHELSVNFTLLLILLHVMGVAASSLVHGENLVRAMFTGYKRAE